MSDSHQRRSSDVSQSFDGRMASIESTVNSQAKTINDFMDVTRKNIDELFNGIGKLTDAVSKSKSTDWQQLGVMLTLAGMVGAFLFVAFIRPIDSDQSRMIAVLEDNQKRIYSVERGLIDRIHENELLIKGHASKHEGFQNAGQQRCTQ